MGLSSRRIDLNDLLKEIADNVYFQPPSNVQMEYPCIVYERDSTDTTFADNNPYRQTRRYQVTVISRDPDDPISERVATLPMCTHQTSFTADNLHHDVHNIFF